MKPTTAYAMIWASCSIAISAGIIVTGDLTALWGFIIPACVSFKSEGE